MRSLAELRDIRLPPPPDGGPSIEAVLAWLLVLFLGALTVLWLTRLSPRARTRRAIAAAERAWRADGDTAALARELAGLARQRLATGAAPVAALAGPAWRERLRAAGLPPTAAEALVSWPYRRPDSLANEGYGAEALLAEVCGWLLGRA